MSTSVESVRNPGAKRAKPTAKRAKPRTNLVTLLAILMGVTALGLALYAPIAQWWNSYLHAQAVAELNEATVAGPEERLEKLRADAHAYNQKFLASGDNSDYMSQLNMLPGGLMGRVKIPKINVDLPIFHTSSDAVLRQGAGHMEETTLPVGGETTHAAITAHRGLAEATLFTHLDEVGVGDRFTLEIAGDVLVYEVETVRIVSPDETDWLLVQPGRDLVTLITCDPLGINTERMLVTGHRIEPTPIEDVEAAGKRSEQPAFPWWLVAAVVGVVAIVFAARWATKPAKPKAAHDNSAAPPEPDLAPAQSRLKG